MNLPFCNIAGIFKILFIVGSSYNREIEGDKPEINSKNPCSFRKTQTITFKALSEKIRIRYRILREKLKNLKMEIPLLHIVDSILYKNTHLKKKLTHYHQNQTFYFS